jgi:hypothetical protein
MTIATLKTGIIQLLDAEIAAPVTISAGAIIAPAPVAPSIVPPTWPLQADCDAFYGCPGDTPDQWAAWVKEHVVDVPCPWVLNMGGVVVKEIQIHKKCADSLTRVLNNVWDATGKSQSAIETLHYHLYSGSYNQRPMRGGTHRSMHGYAAALDFDDKENEQHSANHLFQDSSLITVKFKEDGWIWGGDWSPQSVDAMHYQAARVHS